MYLLRDDIVSVRTVRLCSKDMLLILLISFVFMCVCISIFLSHVDVLNFYDQQFDTLFTTNWTSELTHLGV